jgi:hypothetical protein
MALDSDPTSVDFESYCSVDEADTLLALRGADKAWLALTTLQKEVQLRLTTEYLDNNYSFVGCQTDYTQPLQWPRVTELKYASDEIPELLKRATAQLSMESIDLPLYTNTESSSSTGAQIKKTADGLGSLSSSVEYFQGAGGSTQTSFIQVDNMLKSLITGRDIQRS